MMVRRCPNCNTEFTPKGYNLKRGGGKYCSKECYHSGPKVATQRGPASPFWKGAEAGVDSIHDWIKTARGKASRCENPDCLKKSNTYDWSLLRGKRYEDRNLDDYWQLCRKCHKAYDFMEEKHPRNQKGVFI